MTKKSVIGVVAAVLAIGAIVVLVTRDDGAGESRAETESAAAKQGKGKVAAAPTKRELAASGRVQERVTRVTTAANGTLEVFGLSGEVQIRDEGRTVVLAIDIGSACDALPADEARIRRFLKGADPAIQRVVVKVQGTGQSLADYVRANCQAEELPGDSGEIVYRLKGERFETSDTFRIRNRKWAIDYRAEGAKLHMLVFKKRKGKEDKVLSDGISQKQRGTGSQQYTGPGRYYIRIGGQGHWTVRVRDGA